jgi:threonine-phosphate decarboxylase
MGEYLGVDSGRILPTNGGAEALFLAARAAAPGEKALVLEPTFSEYATAARAAGLDPVRRVVRRLEDGFRPDLEYPKEISDPISLVFLCNPNNPTGEASRRDEVLALAERVRENAGLLVVDEAFADFAPRNSVVADADNALYVARSFTKFFAIPGLRLGCLVCGDPQRLQRFQPSWSVNAVAAAAGMAAVRDAAFAEASVARTRETREALFAKLAEIPELTPFAGAANFLLVRGPEGLATRLAARGVLVRGCEPFMGLGPGYFRVAVRGFEENERLVAALREEL